MLTPTTRHRWDPRQVLRWGFAEHDYRWPRHYGDDMGDEWPEDLPGGFKPCPPGLRRRMTLTMQTLRDVTGLNLIFVTGARRANIVVAMSDRVRESGWAGHPGRDTASGDVWFSTRLMTADWDQPFHRWLTEHEGGHAFGLDHAKADVPLTATVMRLGSEYRGRFPPGYGSADRDALTRRYLGAEIAA